MMHTTTFAGYGNSELADIVLNEEQEYVIKKANAKRAVIADLSHIGSDFSKRQPWTNGTIPYVMDPKITGEYLWMGVVACMGICISINLGMQLNTVKNGVCTVHQMFNTPCV